MATQARAPLSPSEILDPGSVVMRLAEAFLASGHPLYLVGGSVRDLYLQRPHTDLDFCTGATPDEIKDVVRPLAQDLWFQGERFGTVGARIEGLVAEITTFRTERYQPSSRHPEVVF